MGEPKYITKPTTRFKKDVRRIKKQGLDIGELISVVKVLAGGKPLDEKYQDHSLSGEFKGCRECHIRPDWLLIYEYDHEIMYLYLTRIGSHSDLFGK